MNGAFLKRVFSCKHFAEDYRDFLGTCEVTQWSSGH